MGSGVVKVVILLYCNRPRLLGLPHDAVSISFSPSVVLYTSIAVIHYSTVALSRIVCLLSCSSLCSLPPPINPNRLWQMAVPS